MNKIYLVTFCAYKHDVVYAYQKLLIITNSFEKAEKYAQKYSKEKKLKIFTDIKSLKINQQVNYQVQFVLIQELEIDCEVTEEHREILSLGPIQA